MLSLDSNHKPECCVALTSFQAFIGFRLLQEMTSLINSSTVLSSVFPSSLFSQLAEAKEDASQKAALKAAFSFFIKFEGIESLVSAINDEVKAKGDDAFGGTGRRDGLTCRKTGIMPIWSDQVVSGQIRRCRAVRLEVG